MARPKHIIEYVFMRILAWMLVLLPYRPALGLGCAVAWLAHHVFRFRVREGRRRLREVFGARFSKREIRRIAWLSWRNFVFSCVEMARAPGVTPEWMRAHVISDGSINRILEQKELGRGGVIAAFHMGSWELLKDVCLMHGIRMFTVSANQKNPLTNKFILRLRAESGFEVLLRDRFVLKGMISRLRDGRFLAMLPDLRQRTEGVAVRFLGKTANVPGGMGLLARQTGVPIYPALIWREGWTRHGYRVMDVIRPDPSLDKQADTLRMTQRVFDLFDAYIREHPEQWFWFNKRWILDPLEPGDRAGVDVRAQPAQTAT